MQQPSFIPQATIAHLNEKFFSDNKRICNSKAVIGHIIIGQAQNKNAGNLFLACADGVEIGYIINILRSCADQLEKQLDKKVKEQHDQVVKRLAWHKKIWQKIFPPKYDPANPPQLEIDPAKVVDMAKKN